MNAYGVLMMFSLGMIVIPVGGFFAAKSIIFEGMMDHDTRTVPSMHCAYLIELLVR